MDTPVLLPVLGDSVESATISQWLKAVGGTVTEGEPLVEVSTDKVDSEIEAPASGVLAEILVDENETAGVGAVIAVIRGNSDERAEPAPTAAPVVPSMPAPDAPTAVAPSPTLSVSPATEAPAQTETGPSGAALRGTTQNLTRLRRTIAHRMVDSLQTSAQLTTIVEVDVTQVGIERRQHNEALRAGHGIKLSYLPFIAVAAVAALRTSPQINSSVDLDTGTITYHDAEHLGIAVDTPKGLFVPVIRDAGSLSVTALAMRIADVAQRCRSNQVTADELSGGTFTITNTGSRGALMDTPIINQPQVAILGAGVVTRRPAVVGREGEDEGIAIRNSIYLSLTYDHRVVDGADAARYLTAVKTTLEVGSFSVG